MSTESPQNLNITARAPFHIYYEGPALAISAKNKVGTFDILPGHADMFSVLEACDVAIETENEPIVFAIQSGIITVRDNAVMLFVDV